MSKIKNMFATPKKAVITTACAIALIGVIGTGSAFAAGTIAENSAIGAENAQNFAFADAGVDPAAVTVTKNKFDFEMGKFVYEIEFTSDGTEYDYLIKSSDGTILKKEAELSDIAAEKSKTAPSTKPQQSTAAKSEQKQSEQSLIGLAAAKKAALADAGVTADKATFTQQKLDRDDGVQVYDIEFITADYEYEYEIDAVSGKVHDKSVDRLEHKLSTAPAKQTEQAKKSNIGIDSAKLKAVEAAGLSLNAVVFEKAQLDREDGVSVYEIEFTANGFEYEVTVNAQSGAILEYDFDAID